LNSRGLACYQPGARSRCFYRVRTHRGREGERRSMSEADYASLGNLAATDADQLTAIVKNRLKSIQYRPALIDAFLAQTGLTLKPEPP
jgi:hypothetical protein